MPPISSRAPRDLRPVAVLAIHSAVFIVLLAWSWRQWPDPLVDFGRELYVPWQITQGRMLYRDLASLFGPLSPYVNALWFRLFGVSLMTLAMVNVLILAAMAAAIYHFVRVSADRVTASAATLAILLLFGFSQYDAGGNYNFITPYSHEATHGLALSVASLVFLQHGFSAASRLSFALAGGCVGLTLLTKPEIVVAAGAAAFAGWCAAYLLGIADRRSLNRSLSLFASMAVIPPALFFAYFMASLPVRDAVRATLGAWAPLAGADIPANRFYQVVTGMDEPLANLGRMVWTFAGFVLFVIASAAVSWTRRKEEPPRKPRRLLGIGLVAVTILLLQRGGLPRALPLIAFTGVVAAIALLLWRRDDRDSIFRSFALLMWSTFGLAMLAKIGLNARLLHYGFYLSLPATVTAIVLVTWVVPHVLEVLHSHPAALRFRRLALWGLAAALVPYLGHAYAWSRTKTLPVGAGGDRFYASTSSAHSGVVLEALETLQRSAHPGATLAVVPEGIIVNYLLRLDSPLRVVNLMPPEIAAFGEDAVLDSLCARPPDFMLVIERDVREYGFPPFGSDARYGLKVLTWVRRHYEDVPVMPQNPPREHVEFHLFKLKRGSVEGS
jgi:hypothetical protein